MSEIIKLRPPSGERVWPRRFVAILAPWGLFLLGLMWQWRLNIFSQLPGYGDALEILWALDTVQSSLVHYHSVPVYVASMFYPDGFYLGSASFGLGLLPLLLALQTMGGLAFAFNAANLISQFVAFAGLWRLARRYMGIFGATLAALMYTFWIGRWSRVFGHLNLLLGTALLPWLVWSLWPAFGATPMSRKWLTAAGAIWAAMISCTFYFVGVGGVVAGCWTIASTLGARLGIRAALTRYAVITCAALLLSVPLLVWFWQAKSAAGASLFTAEEMAQLSASINSLPIPSVSHPVLRDFIAANLYHSAPGNLEESAVFNFGFVASCIALFGFWQARRDSRLHPLMLTVVAGLILMLGIVLRVDNRYVHFEAFRPLNDVLWQLGHRVKPGVFSSTLPPQLDSAVPLPTMLLVIFIPFIEGARYFSRFGFVAGPGFFILLAYGMERLRSPLLRVLLAALLLFELYPMEPLLGVPFPVAPHPILQWLGENLAPSDAVIDVYPDAPDHLILLQGGDVTWEAHLHERPIVSGPGSVWPANTQSIFYWLWFHPHALQTSELPGLLHAYQVRYVLLHMATPFAAAALLDVGRNPAFRVANCAGPDEAQIMWPYTICAVELLP